ncbi:GNAT superfamily N-acetyltransferase [Nakamurella sp. UYEF19]|uniref:GNAT family N-acetyltransferase n=1 Tax=Nakamurella sp. UYEF19 TaxID=1756392 RepID=UPI0033932EDC
MIRGPSPCTLGGPADITIAPERDALLFEATAFRANGVSAVPGELHPVNSQGFPGLTLFLARRRGIPIGTALSVRHSSGVVVSAINVVPEERRRGVGRALTAAALLVAPELPATLAASDLGQSAYRQLGFIEMHRPAHWMPPRPAI